MWQNSWVALDVETTGVRRTARIIEVGLVYFENGKPVDEWGKTINPPGLNWEEPDAKEALALNGLSKEACADSPSFGEIFEELSERLTEAVWVGHNLEFDLRMLKHELFRLNIEWSFKPQLQLCTRRLSYKLESHERSFKLTDVAARWGVEYPSKHRAVADAKVSGLVLQKMIEKGSLPLDPQHIAGFQQHASIAWLYRPKERNT